MGWGRRGRRGRRLTTGRLQPPPKGDESCLLCLRGEATATQHARGKEALSHAAGCLRGVKGTRGEPQAMVPGGLQLPCYPPTYLRASVYVMPMYLQHQQQHVARSTQRAARGRRATSETLVVHCELVGAWVLSWLSRKYAIDHDDSSWSRVV